MELTLNSIGIIDDSAIKLDGLTVITGINASGKTTAGKVLYSLFDAVENIEAKAFNETRMGTMLSLTNIRKSNFASSILDTYPEGSENELARMLRTPVPLFRDYKHARDHIECLKALLRSFDVDEYREKLGEKLTEKNARRISENYTKDLPKWIDLLNAVEQAAQPEKNPAEYTKKQIRETLTREFRGQISPVTVERVFSRIKVSDDEKTVFDISLSDDGFFVKYDAAANEVSNIFLLDDAQDLEYAGTVTCALPDDDSGLSLTESELIEYLTAYSALSHNEKNRLYLSRLGEKKPAAPVSGDAYEKLCSLIPGYFEKDGAMIFYRMEGYKLNVANLSAGTKVLSVLKILMELGLVGKGTVLILDEPEVHLNPAWQNNYAEILTLLAKDGVKILLTTHSPNFLLALETYSMMHKTKNLFRVYTTRMEEDKKLTNLVDVSDNLEQAYEILATPYCEMDSLRYSLSEDEEENE